MGQWYQRREHGRYRAMMDRRRLLCIEVVLLAAVVACTGSEGPSVEELSTTQLVELAETGPLPTEGALGWVCRLRIRAVIRAVPTKLDQMNEYSQSNSYGPHMTLTRVPMIFFSTLTLSYTQLRALSPCLCACEMSQ